METPALPTAATDTVAVSTEDPASVASSTGELVAKHRKQRSDAGVPRGPRKPKVETQVVETDTALQVNLELVQKSVEAIVGAIDGILCRRIALKAKRLGCDDQLAEEFWRTAGMTKSEAEVISKSTSAIFARHEILARYAPEIMLGCVVTAYGVRMVTVIKRLDDIEQKQLKSRNHEPASPAK